MSAVSSNEPPAARIARKYGRAYETYRRDKATRFALTWTPVLVASIVAGNLWIAFTGEGRATWAWLEG